jgi:hypothetical protein
MQVAEEQSDHSRRVTTLVVKGGRGKGAKGGGVGKENLGGMETEDISPRSGGKTGNK